MNKTNIDFTPEQLIALYRGTSSEGRKAIKEALGDKFSETLPVIERVKPTKMPSMSLARTIPMLK